MAPRRSWCEAPLAPSLRELLSAARLRECRRLNGVNLWFCIAIVGVANLATRWHEVPLPPLEGEVPNEREAEGFV